MRTETLSKVKRIEALENDYGRIKAYAILFGSGKEIITGHIRLKKICDAKNINIYDIQDRPNEFISVLKELHS